MHIWPITGLPGCRVAGLPACLPACLVPCAKYAIFHSFKSQLILFDRLDRLDRLDGSTGSPGIELCCSAA